MTDMLKSLDKAKGNPVSTKVEMVPKACRCAQKSIHSSVRHLKHPDFGSIHVYTVECIVCYGHCLFTYVRSSSMKSLHVTMCQFRSGCKIKDLPSELSVPTENDKYNDIRNCIQY